MAEGGLQREEGWVEVCLVVGLGVEGLQVLDLSGSEVVGGLEVVVPPHQELVGVEMAAYWAK